MPSMYTNCTLLLKSTRRVVLLVVFCVLATNVFTATAHAQELPIVTGIEFDGSVITWDPVEGVIGYNIHLNNPYIDTVIEGTAYRPDQAGFYRIIAFDGNGNFSPFINGSINVTGNFFATSPQPPQNVFGTVFSSTAGEIYWDRDPTRNLIYTVSLNGEEFGSTRGSSLWIPELLDNTNNTVSLTATNSNDRTSVPVVLSMDTNSPNFPEPAIDITPSSGDPSGTPNVVESPQNVTIDIFDERRAELFWDRAPADQNVVFTEIFRDGELLGTTVGTSFIDRVRERNTPYTYRLVAVNSNGQSSAPTIFEAEPFFFPEATMQLDGPSSDQPPPPQNITFDVYDNRRGELFWDRPPIEDNVVLTEVFRDGVFFASTEGTSQVVGSEEPDTINTYHLIAVDGSGRRSVAASIESVLFFDPLIAFTPVLEGISDVVNFVPIRIGFTGVETILTGRIPSGMTEVSVENLVTGADAVEQGLPFTRTEYACSSGSLTVDSTGLPVGESTFSYDDCLFRESTLDGVIAVSISGDTGIFFSPIFPDTFSSDSDFTQILEYQGFTIDNGDQNATFDGDVVTVNFGSAEQVQCEVTYRDFSYLIFDLNGGVDAVDTNVTLNQRTAYSSDLAAPSTFTTSFSVSAPWTNGQTLNLETTEIFSGSLFPNYTSGVFFGELDNGDNLSLTADTGDDETWFAEINTTENGTSTLSDNWGRSISLPLLDELECIPF